LELTVWMQAMVTSPRIDFPVSRISTSAAASSPRSRSARGRKSRPICVRATERVLRSTSRTPRNDSRFFSRRESAVCVMCSDSAARANPPWSAIAMNACTPRVSSFMQKTHQSTR
jgi:hypothetical protein